VVLIGKSIYVKPCQTANVVVHVYGSTHAPEWIQAIISLHEGLRIGRKKKAEQKYQSCDKQNKWYFHEWMSIKDKRQWREAIADDESHQRC
jgi:hypothetical protein